MKFIEIDRNLKKYLPPGGDIIKKAMRYSVFSGGKRIRPILVIESASICGGKAKDAMPVACAIEFIHTYSLIHDDLPAMDNDDMRRGKPTCHKVFGEANAILAGDALLTLAFGVIAGHVKQNRVSEVIKELSGAIGADGMAGGQALDLEFKNESAGKKVLKKINLLKTARLFESSAAAGALIAGAKGKRLKALKDFGLYFGLSFQTVDDHLDKEGSSRKEAFVFIEKAKKSIKIFGKKADRLNRIADYAVNRMI